MEWVILLMIAFGFVVGRLIGWWGILAAIAIGILVSVTEQREIEGGASRLFYGGITTLVILPGVVLGILARRSRR